jgi:hypothetical protein
VWAKNIDEQCSATWQTARTTLTRWAKSVRKTSLTKKSAGRAKKRREVKYFDLEEGDYASWRVYKKKKGFYLWAGELGEICGPCTTIAEALDWDGNQYGAQYAKIDTNIQLEELFDIMIMHNFEPFMHNLSRLELNGVEIDAQSFKNFVMWYAECRKASADKKG